MQKIRKFQKFTTTSVAILLASLLLTSCVTVNVNLPEGAVQAASDDYVKDLYQAKERDKAPKVTPSPTQKPQASFELIPSAYADTNLRTASEKTAGIKQRQRDRLEDVTTQKKAGIIGESSDGYLVMKNHLDPSKKILEKKIETLIAEENKDRKALYTEILEINGVTKSNFKTVEASFSHSFQDLSPVGTWIQDEEGKWSQKQ